VIQIDEPIDGGAAFPSMDFAPRNLGMSLRDYFAGQAVIGLLTSGDPTRTVSDIAHMAFVVADGMLRARTAL
jgi:hypothetical protein